MSARVLRSLVSLAAAAVTLASGGAMARPAAALETNTLGISPVGEADNFHLELMPGEGTQRRAVVTNRTDQAHHVLVYPVDATVTAQGGFALGERADRPEGVGAWVRLGVAELTLPANSSTPLPFDLAVPADTASGDYAGGIVIQTDPKGQPQDLGDGYAFQLDLVERIGVRIYLRVAGEAAPGVEVGDLTWKRTDEGIRFEVAVTNTGNVRVDPRGELTFRGFRLPSDTLAISRVETLLPNATVTLTALWPDPPLFAAGTATASVYLGDHETARASSHLRLVPLFPAVGLLIGIIVAALGLWRAARFVRSARAALRLVRGQVNTTGGQP